ncbi:unnamed protein product [Urochloa decumbens]|uniref:FAD-binding PCMH-type domain-containing protein n=1 Tax=Urochloa decumbens TaxID=240449 RepID=A0ABC9B5X1_9POAL
MYALLRSSKQPPTEDQIEDNLSGNLCRCTGYRPIIDAFRVFAKTDNSVYTNSSSKEINGQAICPSTGKPCSCRDLTDANVSESSVPFSGERYPSCSYNEIDGNAYGDRELIFPPELLLRKMMPLQLNGPNGIRWYRPLNLMQVLHLKSCYPGAKLIVGNSEVGIETKFKNAQYKVMISVGHVSELNTLEVKEDGIHIGSAVRLAQLQSVLKRIIAEQDLHQTSSCHAVVRQLKWSAGTQIRNVASVGGNICTASPISDLNPLWIAAGAKFRIIDVNDNVRTTLAKDFFLDYRKVDIKPDELLLSVILPWTRPFEYVKEFKQAQRRADDIALVNAGMRVYLREVERNWIISDISIVYGGVAVVPLSASKTENYLTGKKWDFGLLEEAFDLLKEDIPLSENAPGGMVEFRRSLTLSFFFKFFLSVTHEMKSKGFLEEGLQATHLPATQSYHRPVSVGTQCYELIRQGTAVGQPMVHMSAMFQVTGEAEYTDDTPTPPNTLHAALVLSKKAHARILSIDDSLAKSSPGFAGLFLSKDVPGDNHIQPMIHNEDCFASDVVTCVGQLVQACYIERVDLSAHGFYVTPDIDFDWTVGKGNPYHYFTYGAAFAEVEIDTLTGDFHTRTVDIVMDLGFSINPAIDIGQIEGAFIQGLGWVALEEIKWGDDNHKWIRPGHLFTCGPGSYKIPSVNDIPLNFKVSLLKGVPNQKAIHSSKAVGEPPFFLGSSVLFAIKDAIFAARAEEGHLGWFPLDNPATPERIRMACVDSITKKFATACYRPKLSL